jgi:hypothetical protein
VFGLVEGECEVTKEQLQTIRNQICTERKKREEQLIQNKIDWSTTASKRNRLSRFIWSLPVKPWTREEALERLETVDGWSAPIDWAREFNSGVIDLCDAVETAQNLGLPLKLSVEDVNLLNSWLK